MGAGKGREEVSGVQALRVTPADHVRMLADLLQPATPDLARRWLAALLMVPAEERAGIVKAVEARIVEQFGSVDEGMRVDQLSDEMSEDVEDQRVSSGRIREAQDEVNGNVAGARGMQRGTDARGGRGSGREILRDGAKIGDELLDAKRGRSSQKRSKVASDDAGLIEVVHPPVQKTGYIEQVITTYEKMDGPKIGAKREEGKRTRRA